MTASSETVRGFTRVELQAELAALERRRAALEASGAYLDPKKTGELLNVVRDISMLERHLRHRIHTGEDSPE